MLKFWITIYELFGGWCVLLDAVFCVIAGSFDPEYYLFFCINFSEVMRNVLTGRISAFVLVFTWRWAAFFYFRCVTLPIPRHLCSCNTILLMMSYIQSLKILLEHKKYCSQPVLLRKSPFPHVLKMYLRWNPPIRKFSPTKKSTHTDWFPRNIVIEISPYKIFNRKVPSFFSKILLAC